VLFHPEIKNFVYLVSNGSFHLQNKRSSTKSSRREVRNLFTTNPRSEKSLSEVTSVKGQVISFSAVEAKLEWIGSMFFICSSQNAVGSVASVILCEKLSSSYLWITESKVFCVWLDAGCSFRESTNFLNFYRGSA
jgi:hypothetical protein